MSKFKIGDKVKIVCVFQESQNVICNEDMEKLIGQVGIVEACDYGEKISFYIVRTKGASWNWHESSLELVDGTSLLPELTSGMRIQTRNDSVYVIVKDLNRGFANKEWLDLNQYDAQGKRKEFLGSENEEWDIVRVFQGSTVDMFTLDWLGTPIWEKLTPTQIRRNELHKQLIQIQCELDSLED